MKNFLAVGLALTLFSCGEDAPTTEIPTTPAAPSTTTVSGTFADGNGDRILIYAVRDYVTGSLDTLAYQTTEDGIFSLDVDCEQARWAVLLGCGDNQYIYLVPGDTLNFEVSGPQEIITANISGKSANINTYLRAKWDRKERLREVYSRTFEEIDSANCIAFFDSLHQAELDLLHEHVSTDETWASAFIAQETQNIKLKMVSRRINYAKLSGLTEPEQLSVPENYFAFLADIEAELSNASHLPAFSDAIRGYLSYLMYNDYKTLPDSAHKPAEVPDYYVWRERITKANFEGKNLETILCHDVFEMIKYGGPSEEFGTAYASFKADFPNSEHIAAIDEMNTKWATIAEGTPAPNFTAFTQEGEKVSLADLKGKPVYIDVWATWCGPCRGEIPSLKKIEHEFEGTDIVFLSVSIDDTREEWIEMVVDEELGGQQWFVEGAWKSDLNKHYLINSIPRFMLIDANGNIVDATAPRPSQHDKLTALLYQQLDGPVAMK